MNSFNAVGFLALGSLMNAIPAVVPSLVARGPLLGDMTASAIWLHFMGFILGLIGSSWMMREVFAYYTAVRSVAVRRAAPAIQPVYGQERIAVAQSV